MMVFRSACKLNRGKRWCLSMLACLIASPAWAGFPDEILGAYSTNRTCDADVLMVVNPDSASIEANGELIVIDAWNVCLTCAAGMTSDGAEVLAFPEGLDEAPVFSFVAGPPRRVRIEYWGQTQLKGPLAAVHRADELLRCQ